MLSSNQVLVPPLQKKKKDDVGLSAKADSSFMLSTTYNLFTKLVGKQLTYMNTSLTTAVFTHTWY